MSDDLTLTTDFTVSCPPDCTHQNCVLPCFAPKHAPHRSALQKRILNLHKLPHEKATNVVTRVTKSTDRTLARVNDCVVISDTRQAHCHVYVHEKVPNSSTRQPMSYCAEPLCNNGRLKVRFLNQEEIDARSSSGHAEEEDSDSSLGSTDSITDEQAHEVLDSMDQPVCSVPDYELTAPPLHSCGVCGRRGVEFAIESCGHLTRCVECALGKRTCPTCGRNLVRVPRNARK